MQIIDKNQLNESSLDNLFMLYFSKVDSDVTLLEDYIENSKKAGALEEELRETLNNKQIQDLEELTILLNKVSFTMHRAYFKEGFVQGMKLLLEVSSSD